MSKDDRIAARVDDETRQRLDDVCAKYEMNESQVVRLCLRYGLTIVEEEGIDAIVDRDETAAA